MTGKKPEDESDQCPADRIETVALEDVLALEEGDAIAVRTSLKGCADVFAGIIKADPPSITKVESDVDEFYSAYLVPIETNLWWRVDDEGIEDRIHKLDELPSYQKAMGEPLSEPPSCSLDYREEDGVLFTVPSPVYGGGRVRFYARDMPQHVVALESGDIVNPETLIPDDYDHK